MKKKAKWIYFNAEAIISGILLSLIVVILLIQVIGRYIFNTSFSATIELVQFAFVGLIYITASLGAQKGIHVRVTAHLNLLPRKIKNILFILVDLIWISFNIFVIYTSILLFISMIERPLYSTILGLDMKYIGLIVPLGFLFQIIRIIEFRVKALSEKRGNHYVD